MKYTVNLPVTFELDPASPAVQLFEFSVHPADHDEFFLTLARGVLAPAVAEANDGGKWCIMSI
jgi:hypothetical protein